MLGVYIKTWVWMPCWLLEKDKEFYSFLREWNGGWRVRNQLWNNFVTLCFWRDNFFFFYWDKLWLFFFHFPCCMQTGNPGSLNWRTCWLHFFVITLKKSLINSHHQQIFSQNSFVTTSFLAEICSLPFPIGDYQKC